MQQPSMLEAFKEYPVFFLLALLVATAALVVAIAALVASGVRKPLAGVALFLAFAAVASGEMGLLHEKSIAERMLTAPGLSARDKEQITAYIESEGRYNLFFGLIVAAPGALLGAIALVVAMRRKSALRP